MYRFISSSQLDRLAAEMGDLLDRHAPANPLEPVEIVVPNRDHARWLSFRLAERNGIAAHLRFRLPSEWLWQWIRKHDPDLPDLLPSDPMPMAWSIWALLDDEKTLSRFHLLKSWLDRQGDVRTLRQWQIAKQISLVFDQYQVYRPEMLLRWAGNQESGAGGESIGNQPLSEAERWQRDLWKLLYKRWNSLGDHKLMVNFHGSRADLTQALLASVGTGETVPDQPLFLFNPGPLPLPVQTLVQEIGRRGEVFHFTVLTTNLRSACNGNSAGEVDGPQRNRAALAFGQEQLQTVSIMRQFMRDYPAQANIRTLPERERGTHHLGRIQTSILADEPIPMLEGSDSSIEIRSCHSSMREVEVFRDYLIGLFSRRKDLRPEDILVVTPDLESYRPFLEAAFSTQEPGLPEIPFHIAGNAGGSTAVQTFIHLLGMPDSRFTKEDVLEFLQQTDVSIRYGLSSGDLVQLEEWMDENRVIWGLDAEHRSRFDQPGEELHTWHHAAKRGWYGQLMGGEPGSFHNGVMLFTHIGTADEKELWAALQQLIRRLAEARSAAAIDRTAKEWEAELLLWVDRFLPVGFSREEEVRRIRHTVRQTVREAEAAGCRGLLPYELVREALLEKLETIPGGTTSFTRGMEINSMVPVRSLPFKVIALLGLNEDLFPRRPARPEFDLMAGSNHPGERDRKREDRNLFLESVMAAEEVHYTSYVGRNQKDDEPIPPSVILDEWIEMVAEARRLDPEKLVTVAGLNGFSPRCFTADQAHSWSPGYFDVARRLHDRGKTAGIEADAELELPPDLAEGRWAIEDLEEFFRNPVRAFFRRRMGIRLERPEGPEQEFSLNALDNHLLFQRVFGWRLEGMKEEEMLRILQHSGRLPEGWPGERMVREMIESAGHTVRQIQERGLDPSPAAREVSVQLAEGTLSGMIRSFSSSGMLDVHLSSMGGKTMMQSWIRHLVLCMESGDREFTTHLLTDVKKQASRWSRFSFEPQAEQHLQTLLNLFRQGMQEPRNLYVESAFSYAMKLPEGEGKALKAALAVWENEYGGTCERNDLYLELLLGKDAGADPDAIRQASEMLYGPVVRNLNRKETE